MQRRRFLVGSGIAALAAPLSNHVWAANVSAADVIPRIVATDKATVKIRSLEIGTGAPKIISSITAANQEDALRQAKAITASAEVDIAELRLDYLSFLTQPEKVVELVKNLLIRLENKPLLATFRSEAEGGKQTLSDEEYFSLYQALLSGTNVDLIDVEMMKPEVRVKQLIRSAHAHNCAVILSNHDFKKTPSHSVIIARLQKQQSLGADILKIATMPNEPADVLTLMSASQEMYTRYADRPLLTISMGPMGVTSRLAGQLTGSALTYASLGSSSAPGQMKADFVKSAVDAIQKSSQG